MLKDLQDQFSSTWIIYHKLLSYKKYRFRNEDQAKMFQELLKHFGYESKIEKEEIDEVYHIFVFELVLL